jgi:hypothetical protein
MTDKKTTQWFDTIFYNGWHKPILLAMYRDAADRYSILSSYFTAYDFVVVDKEELERCIIYKSERHDIDLVYTRQHLGLRTGDTYVRLGFPNKDAEISVCEGTGLLCISHRDGQTTHVLLYDIRHGTFIFQSPVSQNRPDAEAFRDKIREMVDNNKDITATEMYKQLVIWSEGTSLIHIYDTEKDWTLTNFGYVSPENILDSVDSVLVRERPDKE